MNDYEKRREEEKEMIAKVHNEIRKACEILGYTPEASNADWKVTAHKDGAPGLFFQYGSYDKRIEVSGSYPRSADNEYHGTLYFTQEEREKIKAGVYSGPLAKYVREYGAIAQPKITLSPDKNAEKIARDVEKRLIPATTEYYNRVVEWVNSHDEYNTTTVATLETIKAAPLTEREAREFKFTDYTEPKDGRDYGTRIHVEASHKRADVEIHNLTAEEAARLVALVREI